MTLYKSHPNPITILGLRINPHLFRSALISVALIALYRAGVLVSIPFLNEAGINDQLGGAVVRTASKGSLSIFMLGIMPYASTYLFIEILTLFVPFLKRLRHVGYKGRRKLKRIALSSSIVLAVLHANGLVIGLKGLTFSDGSSALNMSTSFEHVLLVCILIVCFYGLVALCELISRFGIGNGISLVILAGVCAKFANELPRHLERHSFYGQVAYFYAAIALIGLIIFAYALLKPSVSIPAHHENSDTTVGHLKLNLSPSSTEPLTFASTIIMIPVTIVHFFNLETRFIVGFQPHAFWYNAIIALLVILISFILGWAFLHPKRRINKLKSWGWHLDDSNGEAADYLLKRQFIFNLPWTLFLCLLAVVPAILISGAGVPFYIGGSSIPLVVAICLDLIDRFKFSQKTNHRPVKIAELHDIYDADMVKAHLASAGIECHLQGYYHRKLLYFFGPIIDVSLLVADRDIETANELIRKYYGGLGLVSE